MESIQKKSNGKPREECGIVAIISKNPSTHVAQAIFQGLMAVQHRGQEAAGISVFDANKSINTIREHGLLFEALPLEKLSKLWGNVGIGHVRYGTAGGKDINNAQPFPFETPQTPPFAIAFNGNITNYHLLKEQLKSKGIIFLTNGDTEVIANLIAANTLVTKDWVENLEFTSKLLDGAFSLVLLTNEGDVYAYRSGNKPLCYGTANILNTECYIIASESCAIISLGGKLIGDIQAGEILHVHQDHFFHREKLLPAEKNHCVFEYVYFSRGDSIIDGKSVHKTRERLGRNLAKADEEFLNSREDIIVVPVPDSGRSSALGYAAESGIRYEEGLMKNRYVFRSFIAPSQAERMNLVRMKLNPVESIVKGKEIVLIDDSIVRGTTMGRIVKLLRQAGALKIHVRSSCPPVRSPCFYGVDFPSREELIYCRKELTAKNHEEACIQIANEIGADSVKYLSIEGLIDAVELPKKDLCLACYNGKYWFKSDRTKEFLTNGRI
ncbi:amidophosphoribosyltransferase [Candidatus Lokiarchaeum ossiferum]|uniref:amidophosphoribosyltransferase n=1 Tax=Candidatus Lokiarchaeum ossiferum TaxID=2951803 RepID=UPI00352E2FA6